MIKLNMLLQPDSEQVATQAGLFFITTKKSLQAGLKKQQRSLETFRHLTSSLPSNVPHTSDHMTTASFKDHQLVFI